MLLLYILLVGCSALQCVTQNQANSISMFGGVIGTTAITGNQARPLASVGGCVGDVCMTSNQARHGGFTR